MVYRKNLYFLDQDFYSIFSLIRIRSLAIIELLLIYSDSLLIEISII